MFWNSSFSEEALREWYTRAQKTRESARSSVTTSPRPLSKDGSLFRWWLRSLSNSKRLGFYLEGSCINSSERERDSSIHSTYIHSFDRYSASTMYLTGCRVHRETKTTTSLPTDNLCFDLSVFPGQHLLLMILGKQSDGSMISILFFEEFPHGCVCACVSWSRWERECWWKLPPAKLPCLEFLKQTKTKSTRRQTGYVQHGCPLPVDVQFPKSSHCCPFLPRCQRECPISANLFPITRTPVTKKLDKNNQLSHCGSKLGSN